MTTKLEPMDVDSFQDDNGEDEVDTHSDIFRDDGNSSSSPALIIPESRYENKGGAFTTGIDIFSKDEQQKMVERAKRFGLKVDGNSSTVLQEHDLYMSMGIDGGNENAKYVRLNTLHIRGTENMSTKDVFEYFGTYAPASIEWINDVSCNVVWLDKISAARALMGLSKRIIGLGEKTNRNSMKKANGSNCEIECDETNVNSSIDVTKGNQAMGNECEKDDNTISLSAINFPLPPGVWRKGVNCPKSKTILLRFATSSDKKQQHAEKLSDYYKKYGNPNFGGMRGILTDSRKRMYKQTRSTRRRQISEVKDEDDGKRMKNPWGMLSETWGANDFVESDFIRQPRPNNIRAESISEKGSIKERLGSKSIIKEPEIIHESFSEESSDSDSGWNRRSKVMRMRMHADDEEEKVQKKRLKQLTDKMHEKLSGCDLRSRLGRPKPQLYRDAIQVIVTNTVDKYQNSNLLSDQDDAGEEVVKSVEAFPIVDDEKEEGEWEEDAESSDVNDSTAEVVVDQQKHESNEEEQEEEKGEQSDSDGSSDISEKEVQGPQGSVIKVIPRAKPRVASTVWARLNQDAQKRNQPNSDRQDLRASLKGDLRSRLGYHNRERSPLRIEVKNDIYTQDHSESE